MSARSHKLDKLIARRKDLDAQIDRIKAAQAAEARKRDTRRKILVGSLVLGMAERGEWSRDELIGKLDRYLTREHDRALFELAPRTQARLAGASESSAGNAEGAEGQGRTAAGQGRERRSRAAAG